MSSGCTSYAVIIVLGCICKYIYTCKEKSSLKNIWCDLMYVLGFLSGATVQPFLQSCFCHVRLMSYYSGIF